MIGQAGLEFSILFPSDSRVLVLFILLWTAKTLKIYFVSSECLHLNGFMCNMYCGLRETGMSGF